MSNRKEFSPQMETRHIALCASSSSTSGNPVKIAVHANNQPSGEKKKTPVVA